MAAGVVLAAFLFIAKGKMMNAENAQRIKYTGLARDGKLCGTIAGCMRKWKARQEAKPKPYTSRTMELIKKRSTPVLVPLGLYGEQQLQEARNRDKRVLWSGVECGLKHRVYTTGDNGNRRKKSTFQRWLVIESWALVHPKRLKFYLDGNLSIIKAPRGYRWDADANGLRLVGRLGDYHPSATDLLDGSFLAKLRENAATRRKERAKSRKQLSMVKRAEREGATICLADSLRAGNCEIGSVFWAKRHGLDQAEHYKPSKVLSLANGDASRVAIVAAAAIRRHQKEMERGHCVLAEHYA